MQRRKCTGTPAGTGAAPTAVGKPNSTVAATVTGTPTAAAAAQTAITAPNANGIPTASQAIDLKQQTDAAASAFVAMSASQAATILGNMSLKDGCLSSDNAAVVQKKLDGLPVNPQPMDELVKTYSQMPATGAASLISELMKTNSKEAVSIMANLDAGMRASILTAMSSSKDPAGLKSATAISQMLLKAN